MGVFLYVLLDGFDLGVGMLYGLAPERMRDLVMNSIAPVWDGNETWLILGGIGLLAAFPLAFAIIIPAVYFPVIAMLLGLVFRGVAFEFQFKHPPLRRFWSGGFCVGSAVAAFSQGAILGALIQGIQVSGRNFSGGSFDWLSPFSVVTGVALMLGYALLGASWLIIKAEGDLQSWAREKARLCLIGVCTGDRRRQCLDTVARSVHCSTLVYLARSMDFGTRPTRHCCSRGAWLAISRPGQHRGTLCGGNRTVSDVISWLWRGEAIGDRTILLHAEHGLGDTLQFCRYVPLMVCRIILEVQAPLVRLLSRLPGVMQIVARGDKLPPFDLHCPLLSLPHAFGTTLDTIPAGMPYLSADPALAANWQERLLGLDGLRIGLVWAGGRRFKDDRRRSIALKTLAPLGDVSGVSFVSLQKDEAAAQAADPPHGMMLHDFTTDLHDFEDTAALVVNLDLVISVDTAVAHLAGALGKPVWLLNRCDTDWRWLLNRDDSPWYPTLRQFRQSRPGDWNSAICAARDALQRLMADHCR